jgi:hypothetical protein
MLWTLYHSSRSAERYAVPVVHLSRLARTQPHYVKDGHRVGDMKNRCIA